MSEGLAGWPLRPGLAALPAYRTSYVPKTAGEIKLNHNEAPEDLDRLLKARVLARLAAEPWHRYDDPDGGRLRRALSALLDHPVAGIAVGHGANELVLRLMWALEPGTRVVLVEPDYYVHGRAAALAGHSVVRVPLRRVGARYQLDVAAILAAPAGDPALLILSQPNNPTGSLLDGAQIDAILQGFPGAVVLDEAYAEFATGAVGRGAHSRLADLGRYPRLALLRTLSKAWALAGLRLGYLLGSPALVAELDKLEPPYPMDALCLTAAEVVLAEPLLAGARVQSVVAERRRLSAELGAAGVEVLDSEANFVVAVLGEGRPAVLAALAAAELAVRDLGDLPGAAGCIRLSVGEAAANDRALAAICRGLG